MAYVLNKRRNLAEDIEQKQRELEHLLKERDLLNVQIVQIENLIRSLRTIQATDALAQNFQSAIGLTEAIRSVLRLAKRPMTAAEIKNTLDIIGFDFSGFSNPSAAVHSTLKRLADGSELRLDAVTKSFQFPAGYIPVANPAEAPKK